MSLPCPLVPHVELNIKRSQDLATSKFILVCEIITSSNMNKNVFVFKQLLDRDATTGEFIAEFEAVATAQGMADFAVDIPNTGQVFFRKSKVELEFDSIPAALEVENLIRFDVTELVADMAALLTDFTSETSVEV